jgi:hypothetical protein
MHTMGTRARLTATIGAVAVVAVLGVSQAVAAPDPSVGLETARADKKQATPTPPPSTIGDDLIYDIVGPNVSEVSHPQDK